MCRLPGPRLMVFRPTRVSLSVTVNSDGTIHSAFRQSAPFLPRLSNLRGAGRFLMAFHAPKSLASMCRLPGPRLMVFRPTRVSLSVTVNSDGTIHSAFRQSAPFLPRWRNLRVTGAFRMAGEGPPALASEISLRRLDRHVGVGTESGRVLRRRDGKGARNVGQQA